MKNQTRSTSTTSKYSIFHQERKYEPSKLIQKNTGVGLQTVIAQISTMSPVGEYKVYDDARYGRLVTTITYPSFWMAK